MTGEESIQSVFLSLRSALARAVMGIVPPKDIEDIVQETYVRVCQIKNKEEIRSPRSFLFKTVRNLALDHVKRAESRLVDSIDCDRELDFIQKELPGDETLSKASAHEEFARFCDAVRHLPVQCRRAFVLKKVYGFSQREISRELNISESTVEKHIAQGIKRCTYFMMKNDEGDGSENFVRGGHVDVVTPASRSGRLS